MFSSSSQEGVSMGALKVFNRNLKAWWKLRWGILLNALDPLLFIFAFGFGIGALVGEVQGMKYIHFISPAMLCIGALYGAFFETTYNAYVRMHYAKLYIAYLSTKLSISEVVLGEILWACFRGFVYAVMVYVVLLIFGALELVHAPFVLMFCAVSSFMFACIGYFFTSIVRSITVFDYIYFVFVSPMMLFSETYFPMEVLPQAFQMIIPVISPLYHSTKLLRDWIFGQIFSYVSFAYMLVVCVLFFALSLHFMKVRIIR